MIYLIRHGQTEFNRDGRYQGACDSPLTALGEALYWWWLRGVPVLRLLQSDFATGLGVRPAWVVLGAGVAVVLLAAARRLIPSPSPARNRASAARGA